jgi:hypothetical protein
MDYTADEERRFENEGHSLCSLSFANVSMEGQTSRYLYVLKLFPISVALPGSLFVEL